MTMGRGALAFTGAFAAALLMGCGSSASSGGPNDGSDASDGQTPPPDSGPSDAGADTTTDAAPDAPPDVSTTCSGGLVACGADCVDLASSPAHCGACDVDCSGGTCAAGICRLAAADAATFPISYFAIDATYAYGTTTPAVNGQVLRIPLAGGAPQVIASGNQATGVASDGTNVFWADYAQAGQSQGRILRSDTSGGGVTPILQGQYGPQWVTVDAQHVYWNDVGDGTLWRSDKDGQNATQIQKGWPWPNFPTRLAVNASEVFWDDGQELVRVPAAGGSPTPLQPSGRGAIAIDSSHAYWTNQTYAPDAGYAGELLALGFSAQTGTVLSATDSTAYDIAADGTNVYWSVNGGSNAPLGKIQKVSVSGGAVVTLADKLSSPTWIAVDATSVYWLASGALYKTAK